MNQTDRVLTKDNSVIVQKAQPGDKIFMAGSEECYILSLNVELLSENE